MEQLGEKHFQILQRPEDCIVDSLEGTEDNEEIPKANLQNNVSRGFFDVNFVGEN